MFTRFIKRLCKNEVTIDKPMSESSSKEICSKCNNELDRLYGVSSIVTNDNKYRK